MLFFLFLFDPPVRKVLLVSVDSGGCKEHEDQRLGFIFVVVTFLYGVSVVCGQGNMSLKMQTITVQKPNTDFGYNAKTASTQRLLVFSIPIEGALH